jgi:polyferredoxin
MPFPWASGIFQIYGEGKLFTISYQEGLGDSMLLISSLVYFGYQVFVLIGTLLIGRRWHCTFICTMNGCHAESAGDALPLRVLNPKRPKSKAISPRGKKILKALQYFLFILNLGFITIWIVYLISGITLLPLGSLGMLELMKYLLLELFLMCFLWLYVGGRGYCYYCASGTFLGLIARGAGQEITTNLTKCTTCGLCNDACKMSLDIMSCAKAGVPMKDFNCVGCGLCVDACPTHNLAYNTKFLKKWNLSKSSNKNN